MRTAISVLACAVIIATVTSCSTVVAAGNPSSEIKTQTFAACVDWLASRSRKSEPEFRRISDRLACYDGILNQRNGEEIIKWLSSPERPILVIRSPGGAVDEAFPVARALMRNKVTVVVSGICASSCANYVFAPANHRIIAKDSLVLFHGGVSSARIEEFATMARTQLTSMHVSQAKIEESVVSIRRKVGSWLEEQRDIMRQAGIDPTFLERFDQLDPSKLDGARCTPGANGDAVFLSNKQFRQIGITVVGPVVSTPGEATRILERIGASGRSICLAPDSLIEGS